MKLLFRVAAALALVGFASPAFPCGDNKMTTASSQTKTKKEQAAKAEKKVEAKAVKVPQQTVAKAAN